jgi:hypothetical protein
MKKRKSVNLIPLLDIILIILFVFMVNVDTGTRTKALEYDRMKQALAVKEKVFSEELGRARIEIEKLVGENRSLREQVAQLELEEEKLRELGRKIASRDVVRKKLVRENAELLAANDTLREQLQNLADRLEERQSELSELRGGLENQAQLKQSLAALQETVARLENRLQLAEGEKKLVAEKLAEKEKRLIEIVHELDISQTEKSALQQDAANLKVLLERTAAERDNARKKSQEFENRNAELDVQNQKLAADLARVRKSRVIDCPEVARKLKKMKTLLQAFSEEKRQRFAHFADKESLVNFAENYFWIITVQLDPENDDTGAQPIRISDNRHSDNIAPRPENSEEIFVRLRQFIKTYSEGGRDAGRVVIRIKAHENANGLVVHWVKAAVARGNWQSFHVEFIKGEQE